MATYQQAVHRPFYVNSARLSAIPIIQHKDQYRVEAAKERPRLSSIIGTPACEDVDR